MSIAGEGVNVERLEKPIIPDDNKYADPVHCKFCHRNAMYRVAHELGHLIKVSYFCLGCLGKRLLD